MKSILGLDVEAAKIPNFLPWKDNFYLTTVSLSFPDDTAKTWLFYHSTNQSPDYVKNFQEIQRHIDQHDIVAAHNLKYDLNVLRTHLRFKELWCTQVSEYLLRYHIQKRNLKLADLAPLYGLSDKIDKVKRMWDAGYDTADIPVSLLTEYCEDDAFKARKIAERQRIKIIGRGLYKCFALQMEWLNVLSEMECNGIVWDKDKAQHLLSRFQKYRVALDKAIIKIAQPYIDGHDINLSSNDDLSVLLYGGSLSKRVKVPTIKTKNIKVQMPYIFTYKDGTKKIKLKWKSHPDTKYIQMVYGEKLYPVKGLGLVPLEKSATKKSTDDRPYYKVDKDTLPNLELKTNDQKRIVKLLLKKSSIDKVVSTFYNEDKDTGLISKITSDGKLHTNYNQAITRTGRLSSSDPNSQNLPRGNTSPIKTCIIPEFDGIMNADLSQIEWRVPAQLSQDSVMIKEIQDGVDQHIAACKELMKLPFINKQDKASKKNRDYAKIFNFRMIYGGTEWGFFKDSKMPDFKLKRWKEIISDFFYKYRGLKTWHDNNIASVIDGNGTLVLPTGRTYRFILGPENRYNDREIKNYPVQGLAGADILPLAGVIIYKAMKKNNFKSKMILTVHDSLVFDYKESEKERLANLCMSVFNNLPKYIKQYWGINWIVPLTGEVDIGPNYGALKGYKK